MFFSKLNVFARASYYYFLLHFFCFGHPQKTNLKALFEFHSPSGKENDGLVGRWEGASGRNVKLRVSIKNCSCVVR